MRIQAFSLVLSLAILAGDCFGGCGLFGRLRARVRTAQEYPQVQMQHYPRHTTACYFGAAEPIAKPEPLPIPQGYRSIMAPPSGSCVR